MLSVLSLSVAFGNFILEFLIWVNSISSSSWVVFSILLRFQLVPWLEILKPLPKNGIEKDGSSKAEPGPPGTGAAQALDIKRQMANR